MKKYHSLINGNKKRFADQVLKPGAPIVIEEKIDGANASFKLENGELLAFSRNTQLDAENNLRGFYQWVQVVIDKTLLREGVTYYGEWTAPHKMNYGENHHKFYLFDALSEEGVFADRDMIEHLANRFGIEVAPLFYRGEYVSQEQINSYIGKSSIGEVGEGVVIKVDDEEHGDERIVLKFVSDYFKESKFVAKKNPDNSGCALTDFVDATLTDARVSKMLHKLVDEGKLEEDYSIQDMGVILKNLGGSLFEDIIKEEMDELLGLLKKRVGRKVPVVVKNVLVAEGRA